MYRRMCRAALGLSALAMAAALAACGSSTPVPQPPPTTGQSLSTETSNAISAALAMLDSIEGQVGKLDINQYGPATAEGVYYSGATVSSPPTGFSLSVRHGTEIEKDWVKRVKSARAKVDADLVTIVGSDVAGQKGVDSLLELKKDYTNGAVLVRRQVDGTVYVAEISTGGWGNSTRERPYNKLQEIAAKHLAEIK